MWKNKEMPLWLMFVVRLSAMLLLLALSRWMLFWFNTSHFPDVGPADQFRFFFIGMRFDIWTLVVMNLPLLILYGIPFRFKYNKIYCKVVDVLFIVTNAIALALNHIDVIYFRYIDKRMTSELFHFATDSDENQTGLIKQFVIDFWYMFVIFAIFLIAVIIITKKTRLKPAVVTNKKQWYFSQTAAFLFLIFASVIGIRGGFQLRPIAIITVAQYTNTRNMPLLLNTPFNIVRGSAGQALKKINFYPDDEIESIYTPIQDNFTVNRFIDEKATNYNLFFIILESHGQEMISYYNKQREESLTPFLDSILSQSLTFDGMANGRRSIEAITSIFRGLPSLMSVEYISSRYAANRLEGLGVVLKKHGYNIAFYHGGNNGTMNFNFSTIAAGFDRYYGRTEYDDELVGNDDYDGTWGISDMPYLQYTAKKVNELRRPFAAGVFTLSSHHPFYIPKGYTLPEGNYMSEFDKTVRYTDDSMRKFFETMSQYSWYDSTIFVITGDHVGPEHPYASYLNGHGQYQVVAAFYAPKIIKPQKTDVLLQHIDIGPSLMAALGYNDTVFSFGRNVFDSLQEPCFISCLNDVYQYCDGKYMLHSDGKNIMAVYDFVEDPQLTNNLYIKGEDEKWDDINSKFKMRLQQYNNRMINNKLYVE